MLTQGKDKAYNESREAKLKLLCYFLFYERSFTLNNNTTVKSSLDGSATRDNLINAYNSEAALGTKSRIYGELAQKDGNYGAKRTLDSLSEHSQKHAELWLSYLDGLGTTEQNLSELSKLNDALSQADYPQMALVAEDEGFFELAEKMRLASQVKKQHASVLEKQIRLLDNNGADSNDIHRWHCTSCGYSFVGNALPFHCPLCSYPSGYFEIDCTEDELTD